MYANGNIGLRDDGQPDFEEAAKYFKIASEAGFADAAFNLGLMYANGNIGLRDDGQPDFEEAAKYYKIASEAGCEKSKAKLNELYKSGKIKPAGRGVHFLFC